MKLTKNFLSNYNIELTVKEIKLSPANARVALIKYIKSQGFKNIIFADCDDIMPANRVSLSIKKLNNKCDIVVNDFNLFHSNKKFYTQNIYHIA